MNEPVTLEQVAAARETARLRVEAALAARAALQPGWEAAGRELSTAQTELQHIELALKTAQRAHLVGQAVEALGIDTGDPPVVVVPGGHSGALPDVFELAAVSSTGGVGLYLHRTSYRRRTTGKTHAILLAHVPQAVTDVLAELEGMSKVGGTDVRAALDAAYERLEELTLPGARYETRPLHRSELMQWQARGRGEFGHDGARKPVPPPGGGRWRWLKVADSQSALETGN